MWRTRRCGWVVVLGIGAWTEQSSAEGSGARVHLGLETSIYSSTSVDGETTASGGSSYSTTTVKTVAQSSQFGLPGSTALSLGVLLGDHLDLGTRLGYTSSSTKVGAEASAPEITSSEFAIAPFLAYLAGNRGASVRFTLGATAGYGVGTATTSSSGTGGTASSGSIESTLSTAQFGAFAGLRGFIGDVMSIDPMFMLMRSSTTYKLGESADVDLTGTSLMLNLGFTLWSGANSPSQRPASTTVAPSRPAEAPSAPNPAVAPVDKSYRVTLPLGDDRAVSLIQSRASEDPTVSIVLRDEVNDIRKSSCSQVTLHAANQEDTVVEVKPGMASNAIRRFPVLKGSVDSDKLRLLVVAPIASSAAAPDHWIDLCGQRWNIGERERNRLKTFVAGLPAAPAAPAAPASEPSTTDAASTTPPIPPTDSTPAASPEPVKK